MILFTILTIIYNMKYLLIFPCVYIVGYYLVLLWASWEYIKHHSVTPCTDSIHLLKTTLQFVTIVSWELFTEKGVKPMINFFYKNTQTAIKEPVNFPCRLSPINCQSSGILSNAHNFKTASCDQHTLPKGIIFTNILHPLLDSVWCLFW